TAVGDAGAFHCGAEAGEGQIHANVGVQHRDGSVEIDLCGIAGRLVGHLEVAVEHLDVKTDVEIDNVVEHLVEQGGVDLVELGFGAYLLSGKIIDAANGERSADGA